MGDKMSEEELAWLDYFYGSPGDGQLEPQDDWKSDIMDAFHAGWVAAILSMEKEQKDG